MIARLLFRFTIAAILTFGATLVLGLLGVRLPSSSGPGSGLAVAAYALVFGLGTVAMAAAVAAPVPRPGPAPAPAGPEGPAAGAAAAPEPWRSPWFQLAAAFIAPWPFVPAAGRFLGSGDRVTGGVADAYFWIFATGIAAGGLAGLTVRSLPRALAAGTVLLGAGIAYACGACWMLNPFYRGVFPPALGLAAASFALAAFGATALPRRFARTVLAVGLVLPAAVAFLSVRPAWGEIERARTQEGPIRVFRVFTACDDRLFITGSLEANVGHPLWGGMLPPQGVFVANLADGAMRCLTPSMDCQAAARGTGVDYEPAVAESLVLYRSPSDLEELLFRWPRLDLLYPDGRREPLGEVPDAEAADAWAESLAGFAGLPFTPEDRRAVADFVASCGAGDESASVQPYPGSRGMLILSGRYVRGGMLGWRDVGVLDLALHRLVRAQGLDGLGEPRLARTAAVLAILAYEGRESGDPPVFTRRAVLVNPGDGSKTPLSEFRFRLFIEGTGPAAVLLAWEPEDGGTVRYGWVDPAHPEAFHDLSWAGEETRYAEIAPGGSITARTDRSVHSIAPEDASDRTVPLPPDLADATPCGFIGDDPVYVRGADLVTLDTRTGQVRVLVRDRFVR